MNVKTDPRYWDCECDNNYIHKKLESLSCPVCKMTEDECSDSRPNEIKFYDMQVDIRVLLQEYFESVKGQAPNQVTWGEELDYNDGQTLITIELLFDNKGEK